MKYLLFLVPLFALGFVWKKPKPAAINNEITWYTWEEASELNKKMPKKIFVDLYTDWCGWCKRMDATTFRDPKVVQYINDNFYAIKLDAEGQEDITHGTHTFKFIPSGRKGVHELAYSLVDGQLSYPTYVTLDEKYARIMISPGFKQADALMKELKFAKEELYKKQSWEQYNTSGK